MGTQVAYDRRMCRPSFPSPAISGARMPTAHPRHLASSTGLLGVILVLASCAGDPPTGADEAPSKAQPGFLEPPLPSATVPAPPARSSRSRPRTWPSACARATTSPVSRCRLRAASRATAPHFRHIGDALAAARAGRLARGERRTAACRITITVAAGNFRGTSGDVRGRDPRALPPGGRRAGPHDSGAPWRCGSTRTAAPPAVQ